jgi:small subunit ribosomal protein S8
MNREIANILGSIKRGAIARKKMVIVPYSKSSFSFTHILYKNGFVGYIKQRNRLMYIGLKIEKNYSLIQNITLYSKPGRKQYISCKNLVKNYSLNDLIIISTPFGFMTLVDAYQLGLGGQLICKMN